MEFRRALFASATSLLLLPSDYSLAQQPAKTDARAAAAAAAAGQIADFFDKVGDQIYEDCIFELSEEQIEVQQALIQAYIKTGRQQLCCEAARGKTNSSAEIVGQMRTNPAASKGRSAKRRHHAPGREKADDRGRAQATSSNTGAGNHSCRQERLASVGLRPGRRLCHHSAQRLFEKADRRRNLQSVRGCRS